jgi:surfactin synthase thioesterase subunit
MSDTQLAEGTAGRWLLRSPDRAASARLFCFPYAGCGASMFHRWPRRVGEVEICLIQPPGRENRIREPHYGSYERLAVDLIGSLRPYLGTPFGIFGHCGGALAAAELVLLLGTADLPLPRRLFVSSQVAPHDGPYGRFLRLNSEELGAELSQLIVSLGGVPAPKLISFGTDLLSRDLEASRRYRPPKSRAVPCGVTVIGWKGDEDVPVDVLSGWRDVAGDCRQVLLDGGHYEFLKAPQPLLAEFEHGITQEPR